MTRREFINNVESLSELLDFCYNYNCDVCEDILHYDDIVERITEDFRNSGSSYTWSDIQRWLSRIPSNAEYYRYDACFEYDSVDDDLEDYKEKVLEWGDDDGIWDEEDEEEYDNDYDIDDEEVDENEDEESIDAGDYLPVTELLSGCNGAFQTIQAEAAAEAADDALRLAAFICAC